MPNLINLQFFDLSFNTYHLFDNGTKQKNDMVTVDTNYDYYKELD